MMRQGPGTYNGPSSVPSLMSTDEGGDGVNGFALIKSVLAGNNFNLNIMLPDGDGDSLADWHESLPGSKPVVVASDTDGLTGGYEFYATGTNPAFADSDSDARSQTGQVVLTRALCDV